MTEDTHTIAAGQLRAADVSHKPYEFTPDLLWLGAPSEDWDQECWFDSDEGGTKYVRADIAEGMFEAIKDARETILQLVNSRGSEAEGSEADWVSAIDAALTKAQGLSPESEAS